MVFTIHKPINGAAEVAKCKNDLRLHDCKWKNMNEYLLVVKYSVMNFGLSKIFNYPIIQSDFQFLNLSKELLDYVLHDLLGYIICVVCTIQTLTVVLSDISLISGCSELQKLPFDAFQTIQRYNYNETNYNRIDNIIETSFFECLSSHTCFHILPPIATVRSSGRKKGKQEMNRNLHAFNQPQTEASYLLSSGDKHLADSKAESKVAEATGYATNKLPGATASHDQYYETDFGDNIPLSMEETRKNIRPVPKEKDVDSLLQSHQKKQLITPTATENILPPFVQDKTKPSAKTVPSLGVNKSHRSLPRRTCLVHLKEQYHLDHNLLSQPRATKYLVKVRTEISPGRYMAKLELHCSRYSHLM